MEDPIQNLLSSMGWSCDDLLEKLQQYKNLSKVNTNSKDTNHSSPENANKGSSENSNGGEISTTSSDSVPLGIECETKLVEDDSVSETDTVDSTNTKVPACVENVVNSAANNLETETNDSSDKYNAVSAILDIKNDESRVETKSVDISLAKQGDEESVADVNTKNEDNEIISLTDDDDSDTFGNINESFESENEIYKKETEIDQNTKEEEVTIICDVTENRKENEIISLLDDDDTASFGNENESSESENESDKKEAGIDQNLKDEEVTINSLMEGIATFGNKNENYKSENEIVKKEPETDQNTKHEEVAIISDTATFGNKNETSQSENQRAGRAVESDQKTKDEEVAIISLMEDDGTATFGNENEHYKTETETDKKGAETDQYMRDEEVAIISLMEGDDTATFGNKNETSESENQSDITEVKPGQKIKDEEVAIISLMEGVDTATFGNKNETSQSENQSDIKEVESGQKTKDEEVATISLMEDDSTAIFGNKNETSQSVNQNDVKEIEFDPKTKDEELATISLMEDYDTATFGNKNDNSKSKNETDMETDENTKDGEIANISLMEVDDTIATFGNRTDNFETNDEIEVKEADKVTETNEENAIIASVGDDDASEVKEGPDETASNDSSDAVFLKPTATVKEFTEAKKSETSQEEEDCEPEPEPQQNEEDVRNMLRMQILQLRNKKKIDVVPASLDKDLLTRQIPETKKKKRKLSTDETKDELPPPKKVAVEEESNEKDDLDNAILSNESEFLIVNIVGGYKSPEPEEAPKPETPTTRIINEHLEGEPMHLTKTDDYKNVKGWQRKKFIVPLEDEKPPKKAPFFDEAVPSCSYDIPVAPPQEAIKSAFESNLLDAFLVENAQLNISYEVPKLDAEENITHDELLVPVKSFDVKLEENDEDKKPLERYKPKTLAEKRKMMQRFERKREKKEREEVKTETDESSGFYQSRLYCRGKIIKVRTRVPYGGYVYYMTRNGVSKFASSRKPTKRPYYGPKAHSETGKPSLLTCLRTPEVEKVCYKPGPLSLKRKLQDHDSASVWTTVIKKLPKITLEVYPKFRKPLDPRILSYVQFNEEVLTVERVNFALAALKTDEEECKGFVFPVQYKNDEKFMLLRRQSPQITVKRSSPPPEENDESAVQTVVNKLLDYVEISEIADDLIKPDPEERMPEKPEILKPLPPINNRIDSIIKSARKRRTSLELRRLNVKIIDVDVAEKETTEICLKPFCKMGCVCKSLECGKSYNFHCGNQECMLDCKCNYSRLKHSDAKVILPAGTDILSVGTVSHLQKQAKRNLAKVEKEFVQTVIQSNDRTIILGSGTRDRQRRATKLPRKMSDYVNAIDEEGEQVEEAEKKTSKKQQKNDYLKKIVKCVVKVERLDLSDLVPLCLVHELYDCHCDLQAPFPAADPETKPKQDSPESSPERSFSKQLEPTKQKPNQKRANTPEPSFELPVKRSELPKQNQKRANPLEFTVDRPEFTKPQQSSPEHCARTKQVSTQKYRNRNAADGYLDKLRKVLAEKEKLFSPQRIKKPTRPPSPGSQKRHKRKQVLELRDDDSSSDHGVEIINFPMEKALQRRTKKVSIGSNGSTENLLEDTLPRQEKQPRSLMEELGKHLGMESQDKVHLLPWERLVSGYQDGRLQVWCNLRAKKMLITKTRIRPNRTYMNVNFLQHCVCNKEEINVDLIRCLIQNQVPKDKDPKEVLLVLTFKDGSGRTPYFEVCGICEKNTSNSSGSLSLIKSDLNDDMPTSANNFMHKNIDNELKMIPIVREVHTERLLSYYRKNTLVQNTQPVIQVPLPNIEKNQRWCMVSIMRKYSYLQFCDINYSIKRVDLGDFAEQSRSSQQTLVLEAKHFNQENPEFQKNIYVVPTHKDRIFVGPYLKTEDAKIETLDYLHGVPVNTDLYCKMKGELASSCTWLTQVYTAHDSSKTSAEVNQRSLLKQGGNTMVDLVVIDDDEEEEQQAAEEAAAQSDDDDDVVLVKDKEYIEQSDLKRYFVTNIEGLGYIEGTQLAQSKIVDVKWPFTCNIQRYSKVEDAVGGIERQLSLMLIPVPSSFKLKVFVIDQLDDTMKPFEVEHGQGHYAIGEFGLCNLLTTKPTAYPFPGGLSDEIVDLLLHRSSKVLYHNCKKLTETFTRSLHPNYGAIADMLIGARKEIKYQEDTMDKAIKAKVALELKKNELQRKLKALREESGEKSPPPADTTATPREDVLIEISDDEDDKEQTESSPKKIETEKVVKPVKLVPPLLKITKATSTKDGSTLILSPLKVSSPAVLKTKRSLVKVPIAGLLKKNTIPGGQKFLLLKDSTDPEIIKRLKMNSGLQVSVADQESPVPAPASAPSTKETPANNLQVQTCEIVTVKENNGVKCVSLKRRIPVDELQKLVNKQKKQACATTNSSAGLD